MSRRLVLFNPCRQTGQTVAVKGVKCWNLIHNAASHLCEWLLNPSTMPSCQSWSRGQLTKAKKENHLTRKSDYEAHTKQVNILVYFTYIYIYIMERRRRTPLRFGELSMQQQLKIIWNLSNVTQKKLISLLRILFIFLLLLGCHAIGFKFTPGYLAVRKALTSSSLWHLGQELCIKYAWRNGASLYRRYVYKIEHSPRILAQNAEASALKSRQ